MTLVLGALVLAAFIALLLSLTSIAAECGVDDDDEDVAA